MSLRIAPTRMFSSRVIVLVGILSLGGLCCLSLAAPTGGELTEQEAPRGFLQGLALLLQHQPLLLLVLIVALGMAIGSLQGWGLSLGTSGVLFAAMLFGHLGRNNDWHLPVGVGSLGLALFVYAVGLGAGPTFFRTFRDQGKRLAILALAAGVSAVLATIACARWWNLPGDLAAGIFAGSMTTTPGLAAAIETCETAGKSPANASIGYGLAYPIGVVAAVLFAQLLPRVLGVDLDELGHRMQSESRQKATIGRYLVEIANPAVFGKKLHEISLLEQTAAQITRVLRDGRLLPIAADHTFASGQVVMLVADQQCADMLTLVLGRKSEAPSLIDADHDRLEVVVTAPDLLGQTLRDLHLRTRFGVTISRIERYGMTFVPKGDTALAMGDRAVVVGPPAGLQQFLKIAGHRVRKLHETDLMSLGVGLSLGILLGLMPVHLPGIGTINLGLAGGPLVVGLLFGHFGRFLGVVGYMPLAARMFAQELGLAFFLAEAGFAAGSDALETIAAHGVWPLLLAIVAALTPLATCYVVARWVLGMNLLEMLGGTCGAMTSTAAVGAITSKTDSDIPVTSYAAAYPVALVLMTMCARVVVMFLG